MKAFLSALGLSVVLMSSVAFADDSASCEEVGVLTCASVASTVSSALSPAVGAVVFFICKDDADDFCECAEEHSVTEETRDFAECVCDSMSWLDKIMHPEQAVVCEVAF